jgi:hypothetical protein
VKRLHCVPCDGFEPHTVDDVRDAWDRGQFFKFYQGPKYNKDNVQAMRIVGAEEIMFVWQRKDLTVHSFLLDIR